MLKRVGFWYDTSCLQRIQLRWIDSKIEQYNFTKSNWKKITFALSELYNELIL